ncbi:hypothetical protein [Chryseobacterium sp. G0201]|uniref:hypothetical protein n=1 Tax=Chryseobacterium sp. G0201 TaxID=2487065 RepID=UPI000F4FAD83|nr:hypothetical protein [Chryseobacterium sp. G0201]AZA54014.1 hypothetical protein EG348_13900 [Chryseobacterium sp. G0201]
MKKIYLFNSRAYIAFCAKALLFPIFFASIILISAHPTANIKVENIKEKISEAVSDSLSQNTANSQVVKVFLSDGITIYNTEEFKGNVEFVQTKPTVHIKKKSPVLQVSKNTPKSYLNKHQKVEKKRVVNVQFKRIPSESNHFIFSKNKEYLIIIPPTNIHLTILALTILFENYISIPFQKKNNSKYMISFANEISHCQMHIRPPPTA